MIVVSNPKKYPSRSPNLPVYDESAVIYSLLKRFQESELKCASIEKMGRNRKRCLDEKRCS
jgi:hypothetical protein